MNERLQNLAREAGHFEFNKWDYFDINKFADMIVRECAQLARDTNLEDVEGGDSAVLRAAKLQILEHFGVEE